jgi:hypothetical protein
VPCSVYTIEKFLISDVTRQPESALGNSRPPRAFKAEVAVCYPTCGNWHQDEINSSGVLEVGSRLTVHSWFVHMSGGVNHSACGVRDSGSRFNHLLKTDISGLY